MSEPMSINRDPSFRELVIDGRSFRLSNESLSEYERRELTKHTFYALLDLNDRANKITEASSRLAEEEKRSQSCAAMLDAASGCVDRLRERLRKARSDAHEWRCIAIGAQGKLATGKSAATVAKWINREIAKLEDEEEADEALAGTPDDR